MGEAGALAVSLILAGGAPAVAPDALERAPSRHATLDGARIHYKSLGSGREALVLVHGWSCEMGFWRFQVPAFAARTRVIAVDLPGHGGSDKPEIAYTQDLFARALDAVLRDAGVEGAVLAGHSNGTPVVRQFWRLFPAKTRGLVVVDGALRPMFGRAQLDGFLALLRGPDYLARAGQIIDGMTATTLPALREGIKAAMLRTPQHVMVSSFEGTGDERIWTEETITVPLLVVLAKSPFWTAEYEAYVRKLAPKVDYRVMEGVSHFLMMDRPAEFNSLLAQFLAANRLLGH